MKVVIIRGSSAVFLSQIQSTVERVSRWILSPASFFPCKLSVWPLCGTALTGWMYNDLGLHPGAHLIAASVIPSSVSMRHYLFWKLCLETSFSLRSVQLNSRQYLHTDYLPFYMLNSRQYLHTDYLPFYVLNSRQYLPFYMLNSRQYLHSNYLPFYMLNSRQCLHTDYLPFYMLNSRQYLHTDYLPFYVLNSRQYLPFYMLNSRQYLHSNYLPFYMLNSRQCLHTDYLPFYMLRKAHMHSTLSHKSFPHSVAVICLNGKRSS